MKVNIGALGAGMIALVLAAGASVADPNRPSSSTPADARQEIALDAHERAHMLRGMRSYLESLQGITQALADNSLPGVADYAARAGAKMLQDAPASVPLKAPIAFTAMSLNTHEKFDVLAERAAKSASRTQVLTALAEIMANCTTCHETFKVVSAP